MIFNREKDEKIKRELDKFSSGCVVDSFYYGFENKFLSSIEECIKKYDKICEICKRRFILNDFPENWFCPVNISGDILFKIYRFNDFITEEEMNI